MMTTSEFEMEQQIEVTMEQQIGQPLQINTEYHTMRIHHRRLNAGNCRTRTYLKGITFSLFATIKALDEMKKSSMYQLDYVLSSGSLVAIKRNSKIFSWDSDADIYLIFNTLKSEDELKLFKQNLQKQIDSIVGKDKSGHIEWNKDGDSLHTLHVEALGESGGYLDIFILSPNENGSKLRNLHCCVGTLRHWTNTSMILPTKSAKWPIYGNDFWVKIPNQAEVILTKDYGAAWTVPNVAQWRLDCPNINDTTIQQWMEALDMKRYGQYEQSQQKKAQAVKNKTFDTEQSEYVKIAETPKFELSKFELSIFTLIIGFVIGFLFRWLFVRCINCRKQQSKETAPSLLDSFESE